MSCSRLFLFSVILTLATACQSTNVAPFGSGAKTAALETDEQKMWKDAARLERWIDRPELLYKDDALEEYIRSIAVKLADDPSDNSIVQLKVRVLRLPVRNAFAFPNGRYNAAAVAAVATMRRSWPSW